jgi:folate-dependent phosphoribosylglycinamide formyltransferase PurN
MCDYFAKEQIPVSVNMVIRTAIDAPVNKVCENLGIKSYHIPYKSTIQFEEEVLYLIRSKGIQLIALAGFLKKLSPVFIREVAVPILNIHPALLPDFGGAGMYGLAVHKAVFESGKKISGATIHLVDSIYDHGKILAQKSVDICDCSSPEEIAQRVLQVEHCLYGKAIWEYLKSIYS